MLNTILQKLLYNENYETIDSNLSDSNVGARQTPVDLQDIVEKLNIAIKDCRIKNNLVMDQVLSPVHQKM